MGSNLLASLAGSTAPLEGGGGEPAVVLWWCSSGGRGGCPALGRFNHDHRIIVDANVFDLGQVPRSVITIHTTKNVVIYAMLPRAAVGLGGEGGVLEAAAAEVGDTGRLRAGGELAGVAGLLCDNHMSSAMARRPVAS